MPRLDSPAQSKLQAALMHLRVFLASPGDVADERALALRVLNRLPYDEMLRGRVTFEAVAWDHPGSSTPMLATMSAQDSVILTRGKPSECDIVVVILWSRMGSPIHDTKYAKPDGSGYYTGTEWEYEDAWQAAQKHNGIPRILPYRRKDEPLVGIKQSNREYVMERFEQMERVDTFFASCHKRDSSIPNGYQHPNEFEQSFEQHMKALIRQMLEAQAPAKEPIPQPTAIPELPLWNGSPFPGLRAFTPKDEPIFFGRGRETDELIRRLADPKTRFLSVVGASGSGKSSLVAAGLIPRLEHGAFPGSQDWLWVQCKPGEYGKDPFLALSNELVLLKNDWRVGDLATQLRDDPESLAEVVQRMLAERPAWAELLLFIDQFEELFTLVDPGSRDPFIDFLDRAAKTDRVRTVTTMRADFYAACIESTALTELLRGGSYPLTVPGPGALHEMITKPAARAGLVFEPGLVERILDDTGVEPGALALMAFALAGLYEARSDGQLTHTAYEGFHGVKGAIAKRAEDTIKKLDKSAQGALSSVFRELVEIDERGIASRRRVEQSQVIQSTEAETLIKEFTNARLLVASGKGEQRFVEVAHEALLKNWPRLAEWIETIHDDLRLRHQLQRAAADWEIHNSSAAYRWSDERVVEVRSMLQRLRYEPTEVEKRFLGPIDPDYMLEELQNTATSHELRATIGVRLALIGDPRPEVGIRADGMPEIVWCEVPGGEVSLEGVTGKFTVKSFCIAKYPVTWVQYRTFLEATDGYRNPEWWTGLGQRYYSEPGRQIPPLDNHPAVNVDWFEAVAFCRWLSDRLGDEIRLPTEWEWQQAATGGDPGNEFPWGSELDTGYANTYESELNRIIAAGMYPHGASSVGAYDMSGNVWEWCLNEYAQPEKVGLAGNAERVLRGGSWGIEGDNCRCANRNRLIPNFRIDLIGFRCARAQKS
ncbi:MAG: SUMF1/EgtB/PvdO family nonheme iron enzyme [Ketobacter sp.]|nr:SUMF1/EgtB/PvdO family nonheme iron enzyme [Ketobacter sp.]